MVNLFVESGEARGNVETVPPNHPCHRGGAGIRHRSGGLLEIEAGAVRFSFADGNGGGICQSGGRLRLVNNPLIANNQVTTLTTKFGGGIYVDGRAELTATIQQNTASTGGGIYIANSTSVVTIRNSNINSNSAILSSNLNVYGGGIYNEGTTNIIDTRVANNTVSASTSGACGGGIYNNYSAVLSNTQVISNTVASADGSYGGGVCNDGRMELVNSSVAHNVAFATTTLGGAGGGGITNQFIINLTDTSVTSNTAAGGETYGGGIYNTYNQPNPVSHVMNAQISGNTASSTIKFAFGGGIYNMSNINITKTRIISNIVSSSGSTASGGGIYNLANINLSNSQVTSNTALSINQNAFGGGISNRFIANLSNSQVTSNTASSVNRSAFGGGVYNYGNNTTLNITNSTLSGNSAPIGAGLSVSNNGSADLYFTTVASNTAEGINVAIGSTAQVYATLLAYNAVRNCAGAVFDIGYSMSSDNSCANFASTNNNINPLLQPLALNGGSTLNHALAPGSPALDVVPIAQCSVSDDQRFVSRPQGTSCDVGAFEREVEVADLEVSKSVVPAAVLAGETVTYTVVVTNTSASVTATTIILTDTLLGGANFGGVVSSGGFALQSSTSSQVVFTAASLAANSSATLIFTATAPATGPFTNTVKVAADTLDPNVANNTFTVTTPVTPVANLAVNKLATPNAVFPGDVVTYVVTVSNNGPSAANNVVITDLIQGNAISLTVVSTSDVDSVVTDTMGLTFTVNTLSAGGSAVVTYTVVASDTGFITNTVTAGADELDNDATNNAATTGVAVASAIVNLAVSKSATPSVVLPNSVVTYVVTVTNNGPSVANNVVITDAFQGGAIFGGVVATGGGATLQSNTSTAVTFTVPSLSAGNSAVMTYTVTAPTSGVITNTVTASADEPDNNIANNTASTAVTVTLIADVRVVKTTPITQVLAGQPVLYAVVAHNLGPLTATNIVIADVFQGGATFGGVVATSGGATLQSNTSTAVTFTVPALPVGSLAVVVYSIIAPPTGTVTNTVTVAATGFDPQPANNTDSVTTPVVPVANLSISKAPSFPTAIAGTITPSAQLTYTILVNNNGPSPADNVVVTDVLPAGLTFVSASGSGWTCSFSAPTVTCTRPTLSVGAAPAIQVVASAPVTSGLVLTNTAVANAATFPNTPVNSNIVSVKVQFRAFLPIAHRP